ncbi:MAG: helix-hairpin-helix domain-containing protein [Sulfurospirillaceae bacterium]|nr:helix-hairpin-helix domain-containing protein [Sulfurospirillaceae bacterium]
MNPAKVNKDNVKKLTDLPNVGPLLAADLRLVGIEDPQQLKGKDPFELYEMLCEKSGVRHDPCVLDVFMSITDFMNTGVARVWWDYTKRRKEILSKKI